MRQVIFFLFILFCSCRPSLINSTGESTDISTTLAALPSSPSIESSRIVLQAFFDSYNHHDVVGVLATLAQTFAYGDCDFAESQMLVFETKEDLTAWLQTKFAEGDRFRVDEMIIAPAEGSPANNPRSTVVQVFRTNQSLKELFEGKPSLFKIILNAEGNRIQYLNTYGNVDCEAGR